MCDRCVRRLCFTLPRQSTTVQNMTLDPNDAQSLTDAVRVLENPGLAVQIAEVIGKPIEYSVGRLPDAIVRRIGDTTNAALRTALSRQSPR